ncbi:hypothetical protein AN4553.2 [Aspergillus nidulans FGSC A4]|uniref:TMEM205-like domain-containing protein n=1 Tax=Emericella nidulans (strain FGSC A4 / ATCC 38163 / CBS 112.46 / NRRL 194 / M139) TaxID=227321 RepID=Q5B4H7_EMENI|nr:hypothetical protein [Aspergillus nidulans FGSC A4]EAA60896.1 hypothetical protein AN4553.2 [Aspergillus nidulans FGSC A4]CBF77269.1 TPA: conserved hypothetical protein [Aspergillus nidulans FGSC A4]|eukprot:XP_662157.1 hypothetical protein AN4553.2 [Aspergillus nidulans FGSC A4]
MLDPRPFHILSYGTLLGVQLYQSFVSGIIAFRALPRPQFSALQAKIFPTYFALQTALPVVVALTASRGGQPLGISGLLERENQFSVLLPLAAAFITGLVVRITDMLGEETRDGKKSYDPPPHSKEMIALNKKFGRLHGLSSLVNLVTLGATIFYGVVLSKKLE